jgi:methionyl-tRNA synthetase
LAKLEDEESRKRLETALAAMGEGLRLASAFLEPVMPGTAEKIHSLLGLSEIGSWKTELSWGNRLDGRKLGEKTILFPRPQD